ncbi:HAD hydrolase-like protein [Alkalibaculum sp. M08DMB]|uniref:HAD hydrolase-like protein n=1 Tax=Alkalibaculum sporogenes TaxID=2655001 RepID=A0A6A7K9Y7_9FIRM|nr:HAD hydrolase-like protein [Alkalibaculum sporogenes]MPW25997.1 HAD hydrolase-like protein [Alkalibaculum sporogenes]
MKDYNTILFDLDGTIIDSAAGITKCVQFGLSKIGIYEDNLDKFRVFLGPPMIDSFIKVCGLSKEDAYKAMDYSREYFSKYGIYESELFSGIVEILDVLKDRKKKLMVATAKPIHFALDSLKHHKLEKYFEFVAASPATGNEDMKSKIIKKIFNEYPQLDKSSAVMIGDREHDIIGARENTIDSIAVTYGYGSIEEITLAKPDFTVDSVYNLRQTLLSRI